MKELKMLPAITHLLWKDLLVDLQSSANIHIPLSDLAEKVRQIVSMEEDDLSEIACFADNCVDPTYFLELDLRDLSQAMPRLAGVNITHSQSWTAFRESNEKLADDISTLSHLANRMQKQEASPEKVLVLSEIAYELYYFFVSQQRGPRMERLLQAVENKQMSQLETTGSD
jgi:hypothetical protein